MPTYVYRCTKGHTFELFHSISDETRKRCPRCRSAAKRMPAGGSGVLFRGSGFYATDYRSKSYKESAKADRGGSDAPKATEKSAEKKSESGSKSEGKSSSAPRGGSGPKKDD